MKSNLKPTLVLIGSILLCLTGLSNLSHAVPQTGSCPMSGSMGGMSHNHQDMGHDMSMGHDMPMGHDMSHAGMDMGGGGGTDDAIAKFADTQCSNCHGRYGISTSDGTPNLAGQKSMYMCAWLDGCRKQGDQCEGHEDIAGKWTDQQIMDLSEYYSNLPSEKW